MDNKITVVGLGYVGLSNAILLAQHNNVTAYDISCERVEKVNNREPVFTDSEIEQMLKDESLKLTATTDEKIAFEGAEYVVVAVPTDYDAKIKRFNTSVVESTIATVKRYNDDAVIVIKSTIPTGFTDSARMKYSYNNIVFSPEFLREGKSLYDSLYPSRIIVGTDLKDLELREKSAHFATLLKNGGKKPDTEILITSNTEAEAVKLFSNAYLAMRVSYFNEMDTFAQVQGLDTKNIISGVCLDPRIGGGYNNPSFGYGGYCFPKDTKQLFSDFVHTPNELVRAIVKSNDTRKKFISSQIIKKAKSITPTQKRPLIGVHRLIMKSGSDNFRSSAIQDIMRMLKKKGMDIIVYEPTITHATYEGYYIQPDFGRFKKDASVIITNRMSSDLEDVLGKVYTCDVWGDN